MLAGDDEPLPKGIVLAAAVDGEREGLWIFDPLTLEPRMVVEATGGEVPTSMAFSTDYESWFLGWIRGSGLDGTAEGVVAVFDPRAGRVTGQAAIPSSDFGGAVAYEPTRDEVVIYGGEAPLLFLDAATLDLVYEESVAGEVGLVQAVVASPGQETLILGVGTPDGGRVRVYDPDRREVVRTISLSDEPALQSGTFSDLALSPDERTLYGTVFLPPSGPSLFFAVDLETGRVVTVHEVGSLATLAVDPDGRSVYVDSPAGRLYELLPTNEVLRYDVTSNEMKVLIDGTQEGWRTEGLLITDHIVLLPEGNGIVMTVTGPKGPRGEYLHLIRADVETGRLLASYSFPSDDRGFVTSLFRSLEVGVVPN